MTMHWIDKFCWFFSGFIKMSNSKSINLSVKIDRKEIDVTYEGWTKIHQLIQECNDNRKKLPNAIRNIFECCYCHASFSNKIQLNHHWAIQGCNQALDEQGNKFMLKPYPMFDPTKGKKCASCDYKCLYVDKRTWEEEKIK
jgi:hypothetical protein